MNEEPEVIETVETTETTFTGELVTTTDWLALPSGAFVNVGRLVLVEPMQVNVKTGERALFGHYSGSDGRRVALKDDDADCLYEYLSDLTTEE